jgi:glutamine---fructose-6-phosphate transaminase (isomerizing)
MRFEPDAPLPGAPDPWRGSSMPERRNGPPYVMTEMIASEPALAERLARRLADAPHMEALADVAREAAQAHRSIMLTGCGTSEHAAIAAAAILTDALGVPLHPVQAFEYQRAPDTGVLIAISHEGGTAATNHALAAARSAGATTALITVSDRSPAAELADLVITTDEQDQSWCHTVGYLSPLVVAASLRGLLTDEPLDVTALRAVLQVADAEPSTTAVAKALAGCDRILLAGSGIDYASARELSLKIEEGAHLPTTAHHLETIRHGLLAAANERTGFVLFLTDTDALHEPLLERAAAILRSAAAIGMPAAVILAADLGDAIPLSLTQAGRLPVPLANALPRVVNVALASAIPLQLLAERLARVRGINPDTLGREDPRHAAAANA